MKAVRLVGLAACLGAVAACSDSPTGNPPIDPRFAMTAASQAEAQRLYNLATSADGAGLTNRATLLKAIVDGLEFGPPMYDVSVTFDGATTRTLKGITMDGVTTSGGTANDSSGFVMLWSTNTTSDTLIVVSRSRVTNNVLGFYLSDALDDAPWTFASGAASFSYATPTAACVPDRTVTQLQAPPHQACNDQNITVGFDITFALNGDTVNGSKGISIASQTLLGERVVRRVEDFPTARIARLWRQ